jgi:hypothetical protein
MQSTREHGMHAYEDQIAVTQKKMLWRARMAVQSPADTKQQHAGADAVAVLQASQNAFGSQAGAVPNPAATSAMRVRPRSGAGEQGLSFGSSMEAGAHAVSNALPAGQANFGPQDSSAARSGKVMRLEKDAEALAYAEQLLGEGAGDVHAGPMQAATPDDEDMTTEAATQSQTAPPYAVICGPTGLSSQLDAAGLK